MVERISNDQKWAVPSFLSLKSWDLDFGAGFEIMFKCMSGYTTNNGKFIMPLQEKLTYNNALDRCESFGFKNHFYGSSVEHSHQLNP